MDEVSNPFCPGAGAPPPELEGRSSVLQQGHVLLARIKERRPAKSILLTGLRGVGKTVLLNEFQQMAVDSGYRTVFMEASEDQSLGHQLAPRLRQLLLELSRMAGRGDKVRRALRVLLGFAGALKVTVSDFTFGFDIEPERGTADSGQLEIDLPNLLSVIGEAAQDRQSGAALIIDEMQYLVQADLRALIVAMHRLQQLQLPVVLFGAGLPSLPGLAGEAKSYAERLFDYPVIGALSEEDSARALDSPARERGVEYSRDALREVYRVTRGYPYFLQEWGYQTWNLTVSSLITLRTVRDATAAAIPRLDQNFFRVRYDRLTPREKDFLRAMADLSGGSCRTADVADALGVKISSVGPVRSSLIRKGVIYSPLHGELAFTVPLFDEFMKRSIPQFRRPGGSTR